MHSENQKEKLGEALLEVMAEKPYDDIRIADISAAADVSRRTFYRFFYNKEALLSWMLSNSLNRHFNKYLCGTGFDALYPVAKVIEERADSYRDLLASATCRRIFSESLDKVLKPYVISSINMAQQGQSPTFINLALSHFCALLTDMIHDWLEDTGGGIIISSEDFVNNLLANTAHTTGALSQTAAATLAEKKEPENKAGKKSLAVQA